MAIVPKKQLPEVRNIPDQTPFQNINIPSGAFGVQGVGEVGKAIQGAGNALAQIAAKEQSLENDRRARDGFNQYNERVNKIFFDGNPDTQTPGFYATSGEATIDNFDTAMKALIKAQQDIANEMPNAAAKRIFLKGTDSTRDAETRSANRYLIAQRKAAQAATITATKEGAIQNAVRRYTDAFGDLSNPNNALTKAKGEIFGALDAEADLLGYSGKTRVEETEKAITKLYSDMVTAARKRGDTKGAVALLEQFTSDPHMDPGVAANLADELKAPKIVAEAQDEFDRIIADDTLNTPEKRKEAARATGKTHGADVRKELTTMLRRHEIDVARTVKAEKKKKLQQGIRDAYGGKTVAEMDPETQQEIYSVPGRAAKLDREALLQRSGRARVSNPTAVGALTNMRRDDPLKFAEQDFSPEGPWWDKLDRRNWEYFSGQVLLVNKEGARAEQKRDKELEKSNNVQSALRRVKQKVIGFDLGDEKYGVFVDILQQELEKHIDETGKPIGDKEAIDLVESIYLDVEAKGGAGLELGWGLGTIADPDKKLFEARADDPEQRVSIVDFGDNMRFKDISRDTPNAKAFVRKLASKVNAVTRNGQFDLDTITKVTENLLKRGLQPTLYHTIVFLRAMQKAGYFNSGVVVGGPPEAAGAKKKISESVPPALPSSRQAPAPTEESFFRFPDISLIKSAKAGERDRGLHSTLQEAEDMLAQDEFALLAAEVEEDFAIKQIALDEAAEAEEELAIKQIALDEAGEQAGDPNSRTVRQARIDLEEAREWRNWEKRAMSFITTKKDLEKYKRVSPSSLVERGSGEETVREAVGLVDKVFPGAGLFLRRTAKVESNFGEHSNTFVDRDATGGSMGIWRTDRNSAFADTKNIKSHPGLVSKHKKIKEVFGIDWMKVEFLDLRKPLISALAARLFLLNLRNWKPGIPLPITLEDQGEFYKTHYNKTGKGTAARFISIGRSVK